MNEFSFEKAYKRLEEILEKMNSGALSLDDSLKCYEEADKLISACNQKLKAAETKIETLIKNRDGSLALNTDQTPRREPFAPNREHALSSDEERT